MFRHMVCHQQMTSTKIRPVKRLRYVITRILLIYGNSVLKSLLSAFSHTKCSCKTMRKMFISNEFYQGELTITTFFDDF